MLGRKSWRSTVGASYLGEDSYVGLDLGINIQNGEMDIGISTGLAELEQPTRDTVVAEAVSNNDENQPPLELSNSFSDSPTGPFFDLAPEPSVFPLPPNANYDFVLERERTPLPWENNSQFPDF